MAPATAYKEAKRPDANHEANEHLYGYDVVVTIPKYIGTDKQVSYANSLVVDKISSCVSQLGIDAVTDKISQFDRLGLDAGAIIDRLA